MLKGARGRRGFTLIETVVTVGIVATLAAVVVPQVVKQFDTADPTRLAEDLNSLKTGIETFGVNVRPLQPKDLEDLANKITLAAPDSTARGALYTATDTTNWNGPYLGLSVPAAAASNDTVLTTGYGAVILNRLGLFDLAIANGGDTVATGSVADAEFLVIRIKGLSGTAFNTVNDLIDGATEASSATLRRHNGRLRCPGTAAPANTDACANAYFLAVPIR